MRRLLFFDFDGTITRHDSLSRFSRYALGNTRYIIGILKSLPWIAGWKLQIISGSTAKEHLFRNLFKGMSYNHFRELGVGFVEEIGKDLRGEIMKTVRLQSSKGSRMIIVSASIKEWIEPWAMQNGFEQVLATEVEVDKSGKLTGKFATKNCTGVEKVARIKLAIPDFEEYETIAYGDSKGDAEMMSYCKQSFLV